MTRSAALLALLVLAGVAACAATPRWIRMGDDEPSEPSCLTYTDEDSCLEHACGWCTSEVLGGRLEVEGCLAESVAKLVPTSIADCRVAEHPSADQDDDDDDEAVLDEQEDDGEQEEQDEQDNSLGKRHKPKPKPKPTPPATCADNKEKRDCLKLGSDEGECAWCEGDYMPASCMSSMAAKYLPEMVAKCKMPKKHKKVEEAAVLTEDGPDDPKPPTSCGDNKEKHDCLKVGAEEGDCAWCEGYFMPASCVGVKAAEWIPTQVAHCKMPKKHKEAEEVVVQLMEDGPDDPKPPKPPTSCGDNKEEHDCLKVGAEEGDCAWCEGDFMPASCVGVKAAEWIPTQVAHCKMPKKHKQEAEEVVVQLMEDGPDDPKPPTSCGDNKEKHDCLKVGAEEGECAWCEGDFMPASCVGVKAAEWIPTQVAHCKMPKKHKDDDANSALEKKHHKKKRAASCMDIKDSRDCVRQGADEGDCAWCGAKFPGLPDTCVEVSKAKYIPETVATCKMPKKHSDADVVELLLTVNAQKGKGGGGYGPSGGGDYLSGGGDYPGPPGGGGGQGQGCMALKTKKKCLKGTDTEACAWCGTASFLGSPCVSESTAQFIPSSVQKCKMGKKKKSSNSVGDDDAKLAVA